MLNSLDFADALLGEAHFLASRTTFDDAPNATSEEKFAKAVALYPLADRLAISIAIEEVFWASLLTEENRACKPRLLYFPRGCEASKAVHKLEAPVPLNRDNLRRFSLAHGPAGYLTWDNTSDHPEITGIEGHQGGDPCNLIIASPAHGALDVSWSCFRLLALRAGEVRRLSQSILPEIQRGLDIVRQLLGQFPPVFLGSTIRAIAREGHGGSVWISGEKANLEGIHIGHAIQRDERPLPEQYEQRSKWLESVGHLAAVDGAVLLDSQLHLIGFGAFINLPESSRYVTCVSSAGTATRRLASELGGGRHRSAVEFCSRFAPAAAIVISEDGRISLIWASAQNEPVWVPFSILGFSDGHLPSKQ